jgi:hypothetical protein
VSVLEQARTRLADEADRRSKLMAERAARDARPTPTRADADLAAARAWTGFWPAVETIARPEADMAQAHERLSAERARWERAGEPRVRPPPGVIWRPTPTTAENNLKAATPSAITLRKIWDLSPIDPGAFDPSERPWRNPPIPINDTHPEIVGNLVVGQNRLHNGSWSGTTGPTFARQWYRTGATIAGATGQAYSLVDADSGP